MFLLQGCSELVSGLGHPMLWEMSVVKQAEASGKRASLRRRSAGHPGYALLNDATFSKTFSHQLIDSRNAADDRLIAAQLRRAPRLLVSARSNLRRWMERDGRRPRPAFLEWKKILERLSATEIADFLVSDTPMARRLRQSSPFIGPLPRLPGRTRSK